MALPYAQRERAAGRARGEIYTKRKKMCEGRGFLRCWGKKKKKTSRFTALRLFVFEADVGRSVTVPQCFHPRLGRLTSYGWTDLRLLPLALSAFVFRFILSVCSASTRPDSKLGATCLQWKTLANISVLILKT